jgi:uncharacterized protein YndB with AHSA1/START domain
MTAPLSLAVDVFLPADPERVFEALTRPDLYSRWMGPEGSTTTVTSMDPLPGGRLEFTVSFPDGLSVQISGEYLAVDPPTRLSHTWQVEGDAVATTVTIDLHPTADGTQLVLVHEGFTEAEDVSQNDGGWRHQLERLAVLVAV